VAQSKVIRRGFKVSNNEKVSVLHTVLIVLGLVIVAIAVRPLGITPTVVLNHSSQEISDAKTPELSLPFYVWSGFLFLGGLYFLVLLLEKIRFLFPKPEAAKLKDKPIDESDRVLWRNSAIAIVGLLVLFLAVAILPIWLASITKMSLGEINDSLGLANAFFTMLAFGGVIVAIALQMQELKEQRNEMKLQREEMIQMQQAQMQQAQMLQIRYSFLGKSDSRDEHEEAERIFLGVFIKDEVDSYTIHNSRVGFVKMFEVVAQPFGELYCPFDSKEGESTFRTSSLVAKSASRQESFLKWQQQLFENLSESFQMLANLVRAGFDSDEEKQEIRSQLYKRFADLKKAVESELDENEVLPRAEKFTSILNGIKSKYNLEFDTDKYLNPKRYP
ncbi:MAG: hypothetical protein KDD60_12265, partial [Bdellovibrionales bacterium]|nr:hypothetical protein [Bdellovibrionales bacterium]